MWATHKKAAGKDNLVGKFSIHPCVLFYTNNPRTKTKVLCMRVGGGDRKTWMKQKIDEKKISGGRKKSKASL